MSDSLAAIPEYPKRIFKKFGDLQLGCLGRLKSKNFCSGGLFRESDF